MGRAAWLAWLGRPTVPAPRCASHSLTALSIPDAMTRKPSLLAVWRKRALAARRVDAVCDDTPVISDMVQTVSVNLWSRASQNQKQREISRAQTDELETAMTYCDEAEVDRTGQRRTGQSSAFHVN